MTTVRVSRKAAPKEMSLEATAEDRQRFCSRDVLWQIVPDTRDIIKLNYAILYNHVCLLLLL